MNKNNNSDSLYDFEIDSTTVTQISYQGTTYFTMAIVRQDNFDDNFDNLVVIDSNSVSKAFLIKYFPSEEYLAQSLVDAHAPFVGNVNILEINPDHLFKAGATPRICVTYIELLCSEGSGGIHRPHGACSTNGFFTKK